MNALRITSPQGKLVMWYKCKELFEKGFTKAQICRTTHLDKKTVRRYLRMSCEEGSYKGSNSKVWVNQSNNTLEIYDKETGKLVFITLLRIINNFSIAL